LKQRLVRLPESQLLHSSCRLHHLTQLGCTSRSCTEKKARREGRAEKGQKEPRGVGEGGCEEWWNRAEGRMEDADILTLVVEQIRSF